MDFAALHTFIGWSSPFASSRAKNHLWSGNRLTQYRERHLALPYVHRFQALLDAAPPEDVPLVLFMVDHEQSIVRIAAQEAVGDGIMDRELLVMLSHPLVRAPARK